MTTTEGGARALLIDITRCIGCRSCVAACKEIHGFPGDPFEAADLSANAYTVIQQKGELYVRRLCMHCVHPSCASVCPVGALRKSPEGPVTYDAGRCLGCRYCMVACPFGVPRYQWDRPVPAVAKCDMCAGRQAEGKPPACVEACGAEAVLSGTRDELLAEARRRMAQAPGAYFAHVYGETEAGGTSVLFLSPVPFASLGFPQGLGEAPLPDLTRQALEKVPGIVTLGGAVLLGLWWINRRRTEVALAEAAEARGARREKHREEEEEVPYA